MLPGVERRLGSHLKQVPPVITRFLPRDTTGLPCQKGTLTERGDNALGVSVES